MPLASENMLTRSHVAYKTPVPFRSSWQASFRLEYCCVTFPRTSRAEIFDKKTEAQHQGLPCSWIFHVFVWKMLGSKTLSLSLLWGTVINIHTGKKNNKTKPKQKELSCFCWSLIAVLILSFGFVCVSEAPTHALLFLFLLPHSPFLLQIPISVSWKPTRCTPLAMIRSGFSVESCIFPWNRMGELSLQVVGVMHAPPLHLCGADKLFCCDGLIQAMVS